MTETPLEIDPAQAIPVSSVREEYEILAVKRCQCEGHFQVGRQTLLTQEDRYYDLLDVVCQQCGQKHRFVFDISSFFGN